MYWYFIVTVLVVLGIIVYCIRKEKKKGNK
ncbi:hypothetical protein ES705_33613 [subsurface metagenome]